MSCFCAFRAVVRQTSDAVKRVTVLLFCFPFLLAGDISKNIETKSDIDILIVYFHDFASPLMR